MMYNPCNIMTCDEVARQVLPQIRAELVYRLVQNKGVPQIKVATWMGLSRAAVSQYMSKKRGVGEIEMSEALNDIIEAWADGIIAGDDNIVICDICRCLYASSAGNIPQVPDRQ
jgi:predicted transcriptional regulator